MNDNSVTEKVEELTTTWDSKVSADHCLHHFSSLIGPDLGVAGYRLSDEDAEFFAAERCFERSMMGLQSDNDYSTELPLLGEQEKDGNSLSKSEFIDLTTEIYEGYADVLGDGGKENHRYLHEVESALQERSKRLSRAIDDRFRTIGPDGESNLVVDARQQVDLISEEKNKNGSESTLKSILDAEIIPQNWSISTELAVEDVNGKRVSERYPYVHDGVTIGEWRPCVKVEEFIKGYSCEFEYFPADVPLKRLEAISRAYLQQLSEEAREMARTFRLLEIRLQLLREVLQQYELYGETAGINEQRVSEIFDEVEGSSGRSMGRPPKMAEEEDPEDREKVLIEHLQKRENWHKQGRHKGKPKWKQIRLKIEDSDDVSLFRGNEDSWDDGRITVHPERLKQIAEDGEEIDLGRIREELSIPPPD